MTGGTESPKAGQASVASSNVTKGSTQLPQGVADGPIRSNDSILSKGLPNIDEAPLKQEFPSGIKQQENSSVEENSIEQEMPEPKLEQGQRINENTGEVEDDSTKKAFKASSRVIAAYLSRGESVGADKKILENKSVDKLVGVASKYTERNPKAKYLAKKLDESGATDLVNDTLDTVGSVKNASEAIEKGNLSEAVENVKEAKKSAKKLKENKLIKKQQFIFKLKVILYFSGVILSLCIITGAVGPVLGGFMDLVEKLSNVVNVITDTAKDVFDFFGSFGEIDEEKVIENVKQTEGWDQLDSLTQNMLIAAATAAAKKVPYHLGGHPEGSGIEGIPNSGLDCAGYIQWIIWTATGSNPGHLTTAEITNRIKKDFIEVPKDQLRPGDIGLKKKGGSDIENSDFNHTGMYAGNGLWYHESSLKGAVKAKYSGFTVYLRYKGA